jgi:hypothetical protein
MVMADTDPKQDEKGRHKEACSMMEQLLGPNWSHQANPDGIEVITVEIEGEPKKDKLDKAGDKYGLPPAPEANVDKSKAKERILRTLKELLDEL